MLVSLFAVCLLVYSFGELLLRYDAMDGLWQAYFKLVKEGDITLRRALENLWSVDEMRKDFMTLLLTAATALYSAFAALTGSRRFGTYFVLLVSIPLGLYSFEPIRAALCGGIFISELVKLISIYSYRHKFSEKYEVLLNKYSEGLSARCPHGSANTLIPVKTKRK